VSREQDTDGGARFGDAVALPSGGPLMLVVDVEPWGAVLCAWRDASGERVAWLHPVGLRIIRRAVWA